MKTSDVKPLYIGIDPGKSGGLAVISRSTSTRAAADAEPMPETEGDIWEWFAGIPSARAIAVIEKVNGYIGPGSEAPGSAMFNFGWGYGNLRMALIASGISFEEVTPQRWQKAMGIGSRKKTESKTQFKNRLKAKAQQLFPHIHVTLKTADALLIAEYCRRKHEGRLG